MGGGVRIVSKIFSISPFRRCVIANTPTVHVASASRPAHEFVDALMEA